MDDARHLRDWWLHLLMKGGRVGVGMGDKVLSTGSSGVLRGTAWRRLCHAVAWVVRGRLPEWLAGPAEFD